MEKVTFETIEDFVSTYEKIQESDLDVMVNAMQGEQPDLLVYLVEAGADVLDPNEQEFLVNFGVFVWNLMARRNGFNEMIKSETVDELDKQNFEQLTRLEALDDEVFWDDMDVLIEEHNQSDLLNVITQELMDSVDSDFVREENFLMIFFMLKTLIECLDAAIS